MPALHDPSPLHAFIAARLGTSRWQVIPDSAEAPASGPYRDTSLRWRDYDDHCAAYLEAGGDPGAVNLTALNAARRLRGQPPVQAGAAA